MHQSGVLTALFGCVTWQVSCETVTIISINNDHYCENCPALKEKGEKAQGLHQVYNVW